MTRLRRKCNYDWMVRWLVLQIPLTTPCKCGKRMPKLFQLGRGVWPPWYYLDIAPSDFHIGLHLKSFISQCFNNNDELKEHDIDYDKQLGDWLEHGHKRFPVPSPLMYWRTVWPKHIDCELSIYMNGYCLFTILRTRLWLVFDVTVARRASAVEKWNKILADVIYPLPGSHGHRIYSRPNTKWFTTTKPTSYEEGIQKL